MSEKQLIRDLIQAQTEGLAFTHDMRKRSEPVSIAKLGVYSGSAVNIVDEHILPVLKKHGKINRQVSLKEAAARAFFGFLVYIPFCAWWGVDSFTLFSLLGTLYFIPMHYIFDKIIQKRWQVS